MLGAMLLFLALGCGSGEAPTQATSLPAPFTELGAAVGAGEVEKATDNGLALRYPGAGRDEVAGRWVSTLEAQGYTVSPPMNVKNVVLHQVTGHDRSLTLAIITQPEAIELHLDLDE